MTSKNNYKSNGMKSWILFVIAQLIYHAEKIRVILIEDIKIVIEQRIREEIISDPSNAEINSGK